MQEILLFGQVQAEHHQTLHKQLTGLTRMQGQSALERHAIFKPLPPPGLSNLPGGVGPPGPQQQELQKTRQLLNAPLNYIQLVGVADSEVVQSPNEGTVLGGSGSEDEDTIMANDKGESKPGHTALKWYLEYKNIPEPGKVSATSRAISKTRILEGDPIQFLKNLGFE